MAGHIKRLPSEIAVPGGMLRRWQIAHLDQLLSAVRRSRRELSQWMPWAVEMPSAAAETDFLAHAIAAFDEGDEYIYGIFDALDDAVVGGIGLGRSSARRGMEVGYWVRSDRTGQGVATTAADALTAAAFENLPDLDRIEIHHDIANRASGAIPPKIGYRLDREVTRPIVAPGQTGRGRVWAMTRADFEVSRRF